VLMPHVRKSSAGQIVCLAVHEARSRDRPAIDAPPAVTEPGPVTLYAPVKN
jgi:hypothetical protein